MALAFDAVSTKHESGTVSSTDLSHTCTGANRALVVMTRAYDSGVSVTGVTYNGVALTQSGSGDTLSNDTMQRWFLVAPATGANNITVSITPAGRVDIGAISLTGAKQSGQPDAAGSTTGNSATATRSITTVADNSWAILAAFSNGASGAWSSGTNATVPVGGAINDRVAIAYGGPKTPAGAFSQTINVAVSGGWGVEQMSISPALVAGDAFQMGANF